MRIVIPPAAPVILGVSHPVAITVNVHVCQRTVGALKPYDFGRGTVVAAVGKRYTKS